MNLQRITISLPGYVYEKLVKQIPPRKVSHFVATVLEEKLLSSYIKSADPIDEFLKLRKKVPKFSLRKLKKQLIEAENEKYYYRCFFYSPSSFVSGK